MRTSRIKVPPESGEAIYHCMTRTVNGEFLFDDTCKEVLRKHLWQMADFSGLQIITHQILTNHFHVLVRVPQKGPVSDAELIRRYKVLHPHPTRFETARIEVIEKLLAAGDPEGDEWRRKMLARMGDVSPFMQSLKQRFSIWFNQTHRRFGTLWSERFKSVLVEGTGNVLQTMAAYIDLNCVRAGLSRDPKGYRFGGYGEAVAGNKAAREGIMAVFGEKDWAKAQAAYRLILFGAGSAPREKGGTISREDFQRVMDEGGKLPLADVLRCKVRYFTDGAVLGSKAFVATHLAAYQVRTRRRQLSAPAPLPPITEWGELATLRGVRSPALG